MFSDSIHVLKSAMAAVLLAMVSTAAFAASSTDSGAQILDTERGIGNSGSGGTELRTAPLSQRVATGAQPMTPDGTHGNGAAQYPYIVAPYIQVGGGTPPIPTPNPPPQRPRPTPHAP